MDADAPALHPELVNIADLKLDPENARKHGQRNRGAVSASLVKFQQRKAIVVNRRTMTVEAGNATLGAAIDCGATQIVAVFVDDDEETAAAYAIADNQTAALAEWDLEQLAAHLTAFPEVDWDELGLGEDELAEIGIEWQETETVGEHDRTKPGANGANDDEDDEDIPEPPAEPITQAGDLWQLGEHRLLCGDSFDPECRSRLLDGELADMVLMDPPFAIYGSSTGIGADIADDKMIRPFFRDLGFAVVQSVREFAHVYVCCDWRSWASVWAGMTAAKLSPKNCLVWDKGGGGLGSMYANGHEFVGFFARLPPATAMKGTTQTGQRQVFKSNMLRFNRAHGAEREHNAAKPVAMAIELIENSSDAGEVVLDLFGGGGSTLIAAERAGRKARLMEIEPKWCDVIVARWERETGLKATRAPGP